MLYIIRVVLIWNIYKLVFIEADYQPVSVSHPIETLNVLRPFSIVFIG